MRSTLIDKLGENAQIFAKTLISIEESPTQKKLNEMFRNIKDHFNKFDITHEMVQLSDRIELAFSFDRAERLDTKQRIRAYRLKDN